MEGEKLTQTPGVFIAGDIHLIWLCQKFSGHSIGDCLWIVPQYSTRRWPLISAALSGGNDIFLRHNISPSDIYHLRMWKIAQPNVPHIRLWFFPSTGPRNAGDKSIMCGNENP